MPESNKILMLNTTRGFVGGVERLMVSMAKSLGENNWKVYGLFEQSAYEDPVFDAAFKEVLVCQPEQLSSHIPHYLQLGIDVVCIHKTNNWQWVKLLQENFRTVVIVHDHDYYCLRRHKYFPYKRINCYLPFCSLYCSLCAIPLKLSKGRISFINTKERWQLLKQIRKCNYSFVLSQYMRQNLLMNGWEADKIGLLIPEALPAPAVEKNGQSLQPTVLYVGQLIRGKGVDLMLKAMAQVSLPYRCIILGRGNDEQYLKKLAMDLDLATKVEFLGWTDDVSAIYAQADLVVVPSRWQEPFGLVGLEAFAHGKAVIAFDIGGISQWLKHKQNGELVLAGDYSRLAKAISRLLKDPALRKRYGEAGYKMICADYNHTRYLDSIVKPLQDLIK